MAIKTIMVPMSGLAGSPAPLDAALAVGARLGAHVEALHVAIDPRDSVAYVGEGMTSAMIEDVMASAEREAGERRERAQHRFKAACDRSGIVLSKAPTAEASATADMVELVGREEDFVASRGRLADLIVAGKVEAGDNVSPTATLEAALMDTGRPVLLVPPGETAGDLGTSIVIGWNGSHESARAVSAALPFLREAERVEVLEVEEAGKHGPTAGDVVDYLAWHGIKATSRDIQSGPRSVADSLLTAAAEAKADMVVMGAYTRSRLRRLIFGGVTGDVLQSASIPVLLKH